MRRAIVQARRGRQVPGGAQVGCVIVEAGAVIASGHTEVELRHDPTAHAEIVTLRRLGRRRRAHELPGTTLYCTLQPCGMCTLACVWARVGRVVYGARRQDVHGMYFDMRHLDTADLIRDAFRGDIEVVGGVLAAECAALYASPGEGPTPETVWNA